TLRGQRSSSGCDGLTGRIVPSRFPHVGSGNLAPPPERAAGPSFCPTLTTLPARSLSTAARLDDGRGIGCEQRAALLEESLGPLPLPATVNGVVQELALDFLDRERIFDAAAHMLLAHLDHPPVLERGLDMAGEAPGIGIVRIDHVADLGGEPERCLV